jgi:hypothetical protein
MKETSAYIERIRQINPHYQQLELASVDASLQKMKPGQSLLVRLVERNGTSEHWEPYLREHWWTVGMTANGTLLVERPAALRYEVGQFLSVLGPLGEPYKFRKSLRTVLLIAYDTPPTPLTVMTPLLLKNGIQVSLVLLGKARTYDTAHLPPELEVVRGNDDFSWEGQVMTIGWADQVFLVAGQDDELYRMSEVWRMIRERRADVPPNFLFGVFQPYLPCGVGACAACMIRTKDALLPACTKGPAFDLTQVLLPTT